MTPFFAMYGREPLNPFDSAVCALLVKELGVDGFRDLRLEDWVKRLSSSARIRESKRILLQDLEKARFEKNVSLSRRNDLIEVGDLVAVKTTPTKASGIVAKPGPRWIAPFRVTNVSPGGQNVELVYEFDESIVLERHAQDLKRYYPDDESVLQDDPESAEFEIEQILDARGPIEDREYLVRWRNFPIEFDSWVPKSDINAADLLRKADLDFPSPEELKIADERNSRSRGRKFADLKDLLTPENVISVESKHESRQGTYLLMKLKGDKQPRRVPVDELPIEVRKMPLVSAFLV